ncbi:MAG: ABC transporter ATP-binding protein [Corynebacterium glucuronolyticum]|nr:ABC transporter ATP-binding protein [Corynebacterium glucuronolyticum]MDD7586791.1 ABC transporter ATP-binding protein [Mycobacteriaceae bacterium]MDY5833438.1 ABC transporter ATP-binding protein [Corynebacterium glucuronolyticum]
MLLDEPTEHIDPADATRLLAMFRHPPEDKAVIIVTHAEDLAPDLRE